MDKRIINTKNKLTNTLLDLISEKKIKEITVLELCKKAHINRTTFYKYYTDIDDLVLKYEETLLEKLENNVNEIKRNYKYFFSNGNRFIYWNGTYIVCNLSNYHCMFSFNYFINY